MKVIVVGAGAAGMMAAGQAAASGADVTVIEKNDRAGKKLMITGKGRCNITNTEEMPEFIKFIPGNGQFLYSCLSRFSNWDMVAFLNDLGVETKIERGGRVFPVSDKAADVVEAFLRFCHQNRVIFEYGVSVKKVLVSDGHVAGVRTSDGRELTCDSVILAAGGASYPGTGSTGDGYRIAEQLGHSIITPKPALIPLETREQWVKELQGLSLKNVEVSVINKDRVITKEFGEMLFTHFGLSGPIILTVSRPITVLLESGERVGLNIDLKPAITVEQLDARIQRDMTKFSRKIFANSLDELLPKSLIPVIIKLSGLPGDKPVHQITREERLKLVELLKGLSLNITGVRPLKEAIVTAGGVSVKEINPKTMESKIVKDFYLAGEVVDVDAYTGGFNLQAAFSMGYVAGKSAAG